MAVLVIGAAAPDLALVGKEQLAAESVQRFALVELGVDATPVLLVVEVAEDGDRLDDPPVLLDGPGELVLAGGGLKPGDE